MFRIALTVNGIALLWALIFLQYRDLGIIIGVSLVVWFFVLLKKKQDKLEANFRKRFAGKTIRFLDKHAVLKAQESYGYSQAQGMGYLVLTDTELYFEMTLLDRTISIPVSSITKIDQGYRLLGVGSVRKMLIIEFVNSEGNKDSIALIVRKLELWKKEIKAVVREHEQ